MPAVVQEQDSHSVAVRQVVVYAGVMGMVALLGVLGVAIILVTGWQPHGTSGPIQKDLALVVLGALLPLPGNALSGLLSLLGKTGKDAPDTTKPIPVSGPAGPNDPVNVQPVPAGNDLEAASITAAPAGGSGGQP